MWCLKSLLNHLKDGFFFFFPLFSPSSASFMDRCKPSESERLRSGDEAIPLEARLLDPSRGVSEGLLFWVLAV